MMCVFPLRSTRLRPPMNSPSSVPLFFFALVASFHSHSWDTREDGSSKPKQQVEAHQAEVNAVAFSPSSPNLLLTASGDKVGPSSLKSSLPTLLLTSPFCYLPRPSRSGTSESSRPSSTRSSRTRTRSSSLPGPRTRKPSSHPPLRTEGLISGTSLRSARSRRPTTRTTDPPSCCLCTAGTRASRGTSAGARRCHGRWRRRRRTTS